MIDLPWRRGGRSAKALADWIGSDRSAVPPPTFDLVAHDDARLSLGVEAEEGEAERDPRSGLPRVRFNDLDMAMSGVLGGVERWVQEADSGRALEPDLRPEPIAPLHWSRRTSIETDAGQIPVIGPGGRAEVYGLPDGAELILSIRRRMRARPSEWRSPTEVIDVLDQLIGGVPVRIVANEGYFECSFHEFQQYMRPAIAVVIEDDEEEDESAEPRWRRVVIFPSTSSDNIPLNQGFGSWDSY